MREKKAGDQPPRRQTCHSPPRQPRSGLVAEESQLSGSLTTQHNSCLVVGFLPWNRRSTLLERGEEAPLCPPQGEVGTSRDPWGAWRT